MWKSGESMRKRLFGRGSRLPFSAIRRFVGVDGSLEKARERICSLTAIISLAPVPLSAESPAAILSLSWTSACTSCRTSCQATHQHLVARWLSQPRPPPALLDDFTFLALLAPNAVWKSKDRLPLGNASLTESLSASDPRPPLTLFEFAI